MIKNKWLISFFISIALHLLVLFLLLLKHHKTILLEPYNNNRSLQIVIFDKKNKKFNDKSKYLAKHNYSTEQESKLKELVSKMLMQSKDNALQKLAEDLQELGGSLDFLPEVKYGDVMSLNTRAFRYYSFYERIEKVLSPYWSYKVRELIRAKPEIFKNEVTKDYVAELRVFLDEKGELARLIFLKSSKVKEYDKLCEDTFIELSPFINPPKALLKDGLISMNWRFILSLVKDFSLRLVPF